MSIDIHAHYYPEQYVNERIEKNAPGRVNWAGASSSSLTMEQRLELLEQVGIDLQVISVSNQQPYSPDVAIATDLAKMANDLFIETTLASHGRLATFMALPLPHVDATLAELQRCLSEAEVLGVTLGCSALEYQIDDPLFEPIFEELNEHGCVVFFHPLMFCAMAGLGGLGSISAPFEDTVLAGRLVISGMTQRYPQINFIVPHLGGTLPFIYGRLSGVAQKRFAAESTSDGEPYVDRFKQLWYDTASDQAPALRCACETLGPDRLVFGTDFPFVAESQLANRITQLHDLSVPDEVKQNILGGTAARLLNINDKAVP